MGLFSSTKPGGVPHAAPHTAPHTAPHAAPNAPGKTWQSQAVHVASEQAHKYQEKKHAQEQAQFKAHQQAQHQQQMQHFGQEAGNWAGDHKQELEGGAALIGAAALIGGGIYAYRKYKNKKEEEAKKQTWAENKNETAFIQAADARTQTYNQQPAQHAQTVTWVLTSGRNVPHNALQLGRDGGGEPLYACRAFHEGTAQIGKAGHHLYPDAAVISLKGREIGIPHQYEILVGPPNSTKWIPIQPHGNTVNGELVHNWTPVDGGRDEAGNFIFVAQLNINGAQHLGGAEADEAFAHAAWGGQEVREHNHYSLLAYA